MPDSPDLIGQYERDRHRYERLCERLSTLLEQLLLQKQITVHSVNNRLKKKDSLTRKLSRTGSNYKALSDVTDVAGVRIITFFSDQVEEIAKLVETEFEVDQENSTDKRAALAPDRFGYLSVHYVVGISRSRLSLTEYQEFSGLKAEVQIRSILQHAWAEIEHDLGYKSEVEVPQTIRREFSRLAGLLELADDEFSRIRDETKNYAEKVVLQIDTEPNSVEIDLISVSQFIENSELVSKLDEEIARNMRYALGKPKVNHGDVGRLKFCGINDIAELQRSLQVHRDHIAKLSKLWGSADPDDSARSRTVLSRGISLFYLTHILAGETGEVDDMEAYLEAFGIGKGKDKKPEAAKLVKDIAKCLK